MGLTSSVKGREFTFRRNGVYDNAPPLDEPCYRRPVRRSAGFGRVCVACGIERSRANKCDCNS